MSIFARKKNSFCLQLIKEIRENECLWNTHSKEFNKAKAAKAWLKISAKLNKEVSSIRAKWKNLKDTYRREVKKHVTDNEYQGIWLYFEEMDFIRDTIYQGEKDDTESIEEVNLDDISSQSFPLEDVTVSYLYQDDIGSPPTKRRRKNECENNTDDLRLETTLDSKTDEEQYDEQFLVSLLPFFRRLEPVRKLVIRSKIQEAVIAELLRNRRDK